MGDARVVFLLEKIGETFGCRRMSFAGTWTAWAIRSGRSSSQGPPKLIFVYQAPDTVDPKTGAVTRVGAKRLALTDGDGESVDGRAAYFIRNNPRASPRSSTPRT